MSDPVLVTAGPSLELEDDGSLFDAQFYCLENQATRCWMLLTRAASHTFGGRAFMDHMASLEPDQRGPADAIMQRLLSTTVLCERFGLSG